MDIEEDDEDGEDLEVESDASVFDSAENNGDQILEVLFIFEYQYFLWNIRIDYIESDSDEDFVINNSNVIDDEFNNPPGN